MKEGSEDIDFWEKPVEELDGDEVHSILSFLEDEDMADDQFYPEKAPAELLKRLDSLEDVLLFRCGDEDGPCYQYSGVLWDRAREAGRLYGRGCDSTGVGEVVSSLDRSTFFPLVLETIFSPSESLALEGAEVEFKEGGSIRVERLDDLNSPVWNPEGFSVFDEELVPRSEIENLIRRVYEKDEDGWIRESYPTAEDWIRKVFG